VRATDQTDQAVVRRTWVILAAQSAAAVAAVLVLVAGVAAAFVVHDERISAERLLVQATRPAARDDVTDPPPGVSLYLVGPDGRVLARTPGAPSSLPDRRGLAALPNRPVATGLVAAGAPYRTLTIADRGRWVQAVLDLRPQDAERRRLLGAALLAGLMGILAAGAVGGLLARRAVAPLGQAMARQRRFVTDASHELRTPLTLLHTRAQLLERDLHAGDLSRLEDEVTALARDARRMGEVIEDLLLSAELGNERGGRTLVDLGALAGEVVDAANGHAAAVNVEVIASLQPAQVQGAETALRRVMVSLLDNAIRHARRPGGQVRLRVDTAPGEAVLEVADDGAGFEPNMSGQLFERFARGSAGGDRRRFGLGLALVREVVNAHGGRAEAESRPGQGATFRVHLPTRTRTGR
jgi:two-component system, OmpR family, sensor kinase